MTFKTRIAATIFTGLAIGLASAPAAQALDAYWHGVRSTDWNDGKSGEESNWYEMAPPNGNPVEVPDGTAFFAPGAQNLIVTIDQPTDIRRINFTAGNDQYAIQIMSPGNLAIRGDGVTNASGREQRFMVDGQRARLYFQGASVAGIAGSVNRIRIINENNGQTSFRGTSSASNAQITNQRNGKLKFFNDSTAGTAELINLRAGSEIHFEGQSTSDGATINARRGSVFFSRSNRKSVFVQKVESDRGRIIVGKSKVEIGNTLKLSKGSTVSMGINDKKGGRIAAAGRVQLGGTLLVKGSSKVKPGRYTLISSKKRVAGKFSKTTLKGFGSKLDASIAYQGRKVVLVVRNK